MESTLKRLNRGQKKHDIFSYLIEEDGTLHPNFTMGDLDAEGTLSDVILQVLIEEQILTRFSVRAAILAGKLSIYTCVLSRITVIAKVPIPLHQCTRLVFFLSAFPNISMYRLTFLFEFLSHHPSMMRELQHEADLWFHKESNFTELATLPILNAVINETMRVRPVIPSRSQRIVPAGGIDIAGHYIPGGTMVGVPQRAVMCDERYFSPEPRVWRPERWLQPEKEIAMDSKACKPHTAAYFL